MNSGHSFFSPLHNDGGWREEPHEPMTDGGVERVRVSLFLKPRPEPAPHSVCRAEEGRRDRSGQKKKEKNRYHRREEQKTGQRQRERERCSPLSLQEVVRLLSV